MYFHIAPGEVLLLTPLKQYWPDQLFNLGNVIQGSLCRLHISGNRWPLTKLS